MIADPLKTPSTFNPYYRHNTILIQFIVTHFCEIVEITRKKRLSPSVIFQTLASPESPLCKLKFHAGHFVKNCKRLTTNDKSFLDHTRQAWLTITIASEINDPQNSSKAYPIFISELARIQACIVLLLERFRQNKNVTLFILKNQPTLNAIFGPSLTEGFLKTSSDKDKELLCKLLQRKFIDSGFNHLLASIRQHIFSGHV